MESHQSLNPTRQVTDVFTPEERGNVGGTIERRPSTTTGSLDYMDYCVHWPSPDGSQCLLSSTAARDNSRQAYLGNLSREWVESWCLRKSVLVAAAASGWLLRTRHLRSRSVDSPTESAADSGAESEIHAQHTPAG